MQWYKKTGYKGHSGQKCNFDTVYVNVCVIVVTLGTSVNDEVSSVHRKKYYNRIGWFLRPTHRTIPIAHKSYFALDYLFTENPPIATT